MLGALLGLALAGAGASAAENPFGTNLFFGITLSPNSPPPASQLDQLDQAGNNWVDIQFAWSAYEPNQGQYSSTYVQQIRTAIDDALSRGWRAGLRLSWQYPPSWATALEGARFVNQYGDLFNATGSSGKNVVAFTFNQNLRNIITATMTNFFAALQNGPGGNYLQKLSAVGFGGGFYGEVNLPDPAYNGHNNCYWAYSAEAKAMFQNYLASQYGTIGALNTAWGASYGAFGAVTFTPGQASLNHRAATDFMNWLSLAQQQYVLFQRNLIRSAYDGYLMLELGGWGMRSNYISANLAVDLNGSGPGADSMSKVYDFPNFLKVLSQAGESKVLADCTWIDPSLSFSGTGNPPPAAWIAGLARENGFLSCGEYTANSTDLDLGAARVNQNGLVLAFYVPESRLFTGAYPTANDWGAMIARSQAAYAASVPYLLPYEIGAPGATGSDSIGAEGVTSQGAGTGWLAGQTTDNFHFFAAILEGDGQWVMRLASTSAGAVGQAGLMLRQNLNANAPYTAVFLANNQCVMQSRRSAGGMATVNATLPGTAAPQWLKLQRSGNNLLAYCSSDGLLWNYLGTQYNPLDYASYIGIAVSSGSSLLNTAVLSASNAPGNGLYVQDFNAPGATPASVGWNGGFAYAGADSISRTIAATGVGGSGGLVTSLHITNGANLGAFTEFWSGTLRLPAGADLYNLSLTADFTGNQTGVPFSLKLNDHAGHYLVFSSTVGSAGVFQRVGGLLSTAQGIDPAFEFAGTAGYSIILSFDGPGGTPWSNGTGSLTIDNVLLQTVPPLSPFSMTVVSAGPGQVFLSWPSIPGHKYVVQSKGALSEAAWANAAPPIIATGSSTAYTNSMAGAAARFYRVQAE